MKIKILCLTLLLSVFLFSGCTKDKDDNNAATPTPTATTTTDTETTSETADTTNTTDTSTNGQTTDAVTTASIVNTQDAFLNAISNKGTWIIAILEDMTVDQDLVLDGEFKNGKKDDNGKDVIQRKLALYSQDEQRNITARYTLTAPKFTINSPEASIQHGTFKGDVYVNAENFQLIDATVDGNVYFMSDKAKSSFKMDDTSKVTGKQELQK
jgi:hypothetical protein